MNQQFSLIFGKVFAFDRTISRLMEMQSRDYVRDCLEAHPQGVDLMRAVAPARRTAEEVEIFAQRLWQEYRVGREGDVASHCETMHKADFLVMLHDLLSFLPHAHTSEEARILRVKDFAREIAVDRQSPDAQFVFFDKFHSILLKIMHTPH